MAMQLGCIKIVVESDASLVIELINSNDATLDKLDFILVEISCFYSRLDVIFHYSSRICNSVAISLTNFFLYKHYMEL